jgi:hypothetical protein
MEQIKIEYYDSLCFDNVTRHGCRHKVKMQEDTLQILRDYLQNEHMKEIFPMNGNCILCAMFHNKIQQMWEYLTAACKAFSLAHAKGKGVNELVIGSLDD